MAIMAAFRDVERPSGHNRLHYDAMFTYFYISAFVFIGVDFNLVLIRHQELNRVSQTCKGDLLIATPRFIFLAAIADCITRQTNDCAAGRTGIGYNITEGSYHEQQN